MAAPPDGKWELARGAAQSQLVRINLASSAQATLADIRMTGAAGVVGVCIKDASADGKAYDYLYLTLRDRLNAVTGLH